MIFNKNVVAILQSRMSSVRLPGKVLMNLSGKTLLDWIMERMQHSKTLDKVIVATTNNASDQPIVDHCSKNNYEVFRGSEENVLERYYSCARTYSADIIVRLTCDDPFKDPFMVDEYVTVLKNNKTLDYVSNTIEPTYPEGFDLEVFTFEALEKAYFEASLLSEKEHVTPYIWKNSHLFDCRSIKNNSNFSHYRLTIDTVSDFKRIEMLLNKLSSNKVLRSEDLLAILSNDKELEELCVNDLERNLGYKQSLEKENGQKNI